MHRIAHYVSGGLIVTLPGPDEDHNPETAAHAGRRAARQPDVPYDKRIEAARFIEDLTASYQGGWYSVISLHGGGSPAAMKQEIWRNYPVGNKVELVERLLERGVLAEPTAARSRANRQPGQVLATQAARRQRDDDQWSRCRRRRAERASMSEPTTQTYADVPPPLARRPRRLLGRAGGADRLAAAVRRRSATQPAAVRALVRRRRDQPLPQRRRPPPRGARRPDGADLRLDRDRRASASTASPSCTPRCSAWRRCCVALGRAAGRPRPDLHADDPRGRVRDARLRAHRRDPLGGVRRLRQRQPGERASTTPSRSVIVSADAGSRAGKVVAYKPLLDEAIRLATHKPAQVLLVDRGLAPMRRVAGRDVDYAALRERHLTRQRALRLGRVDAPELHPLHQRHDRQAQGRAARHRRLRGGAGREHEAHLLRPGRRDLLLDQRHRLGGRPQLHRLRRR